MSSDADYQKNDHVILKCISEGVPAPFIEWTRVGNAVLPIGKERYNVMLNLLN